VMIYWHVDTRSTCIYSQLKTCSSSEVGAMIQGILKHATHMDLQKSYVDTHGQSTIGFAFSYLLHFDLLPRLKNINKQKLYYVEPKDKNNYEHLTPILKESIQWKIIEENYDEVVKYIAALKMGTVEADVLIKRFSKNNYQHPVYKALTEIGKAVKTIFLCRYLASEALRIEIHEALNVVERLNSIMGFIFYGRLGEISTNKQADQELSVVCLHLLQVCMVYINTLIIQEVLSDPSWRVKLMPEDLRALSPLIHAHINPYGLFPLDLKQRLLIETIKQSRVAAMSRKVKTHASSAEAVY
jgi:TnpA family transposase